MPSSSESTVPVCPHAAKVNSETILNGKAGQKLSMKESTHGTETNGQHTKNTNDDIENRSEISIERNWIRPDLPSRCTWKLGDLTTESPHNHFQK